MSDINNDDYLLYTLFRKGTSDDPYIEKSEEQQVHNCIVRLSEIPQKQYRVSITSSDNSLWYEIDDGIPESNQYKVDYNTGNIQFSSDNEAKTFTFNYLSVGQILINSERVKISLDQGLNVEETLQQLIDQNRIEGNLAHRKQPVNTYNDIATTYPLPIKGDMVQTLDDNKMYIWTGNDWYWFYSFPTQQVMDLQNNVTDIYNKIGDLSQLPTNDKSSLVNSNKEIAAQLADTNNKILEISIKQFPRIIPESNDSPRLQRAIDYVWSNRGGTIRLDNYTLILNSPVYLKQLVNVEGILNDTDYEHPNDDPQIQARGSCIMQGDNFIGDCLLKQVAVDINGNILANDARYQTQFIKNVMFKGDATKLNTTGIIATQTRLTVDYCRFWSFTIAVQFDCFANYLLNCDMQYCITGCVINNYENYVQNNSMSCYKSCIELNGDFNIISGNKLMGDTTDSHNIYTAGSLYDIHLIGSRNTITNNLIGDNNHMGILIDTSLLNHLEENRSVPYTGAYGNIITNNHIHNNGHGTCNNDGSAGDDPNSTFGISAGIAIKVVDNEQISSPKIHDNVIVGNTISTGGFKGWKQAGSTLNSTQVGIHIIGKVSGDVYDNLISANRFDKAILPMLWYNADSLSNNIGPNINDRSYYTTDSVSALPTPNASYAGKTLLMLPDANYRDRMMFCGKDVNNNYLWRELCRSLNGIGTLAQNSFTAGSVYTQDIPVSGCLLNDYVLASLSTNAVQLIITAKVISNGNVRLCIFNPTTSTITLNNSSQINIRLKVINY